MNKVTILFILSICFTNSYSQCEKDKYYKYYHNLIQNEKDNIQKLFDGILEKYGDIDKVLEDLLSKLNQTTNRADSKLNQLEIYNKDIGNVNNDSNAKLQSVLDDLKDIEDELKLIDTNRNWHTELEDAEKSLNKTISGPTSTDISEQKKELGKWKKFLDESIGPEYARHIMDIPHSVSDELNLLENLITGERDTNCFDKFHSDLKLLFVELTNLLDFNYFKDDVDNIKEKALKNKNDAEDILANTNQFLEKEKQFKDVHHLTNESLILAEEIEKLNESINKLEKNTNDIFEDKLKNMQEEHQAEMEKLNEKYNVKEGQLLLNKLKNTKQQIENVNIADVEKDIDNYIRDINYYSCILEKCESGSETISDCKREEK